MRTKVVYLVEDCGNNPGRIYAVFGDYQAAIDFASWFDDVNIVPRTIYYELPPNRGYNP